MPCLDTRSITKISCNVQRYFICYHLRNQLTNDIVWLFLHLFLETSNLLTKQHCIMGLISAIITSLTLTFCFWTQMYFFCFPHHWVFFPALFNFVFMRIQKELPEFRDYFCGCVCTFFNTLKQTKTGNFMLQLIAVISMSMIQQPPNKCLFCFGLYIISIRFVNAKSSSEVISKRFFPHFFGFLLY